jgi:N-acetylmuramoyl-L-alanine amidase
MNKTAFAFLVLSTYLLIGVNLAQTNEYEQAYSYYGSTGNEVIQIQTRLKNWGYYNGTIDGIYGYETYRAVRQFQSKNGLTVDGVAGSATLSALGISSSSGTSNSNVDLLARAISGEARGEPYEGQVAVGAVILNRVDNPNFPNTIAGVVYQKGAFDSVADGQINMTPTATARKAAQDALNGWDPSGGCIYFYNPVTSTSKWIWSRPIVKKIGKHNFAK